MTDRRVPRYYPQIEVALDALHPFPANYQDHPAAQLAELCKSLDIGQYKNIVCFRPPDDPALDAGEYYILAGHGLVDAARQAGFTHLVAQDWSTLSLADARRLLVADNETAKMATPDHARLLALVEQVRATGQSAPGVTNERLAEIAALARKQNPPPVEDAGPQVDKAAELLANWPVQPGDLWAIGDHRLLCGDSTKREDVARVMGSAKARLFATDPPYGVDYIAVKSGIPRTGYATLDQDYTDIAADQLKNEDMKAWLEGVFNIWHEFLAPDAAWYLWHPMLTQGYFAAAAAAAAAVIIHRQIIWVKKGFNLTRSGMYHWAHELCFFGWSKGHPPPWYGKKDQRTVWEIDRHDGKGLHPTEKPIELWQAPMLNHTLPGEVCAEPFAGSGSQFVMGQQLGRRVFGMEIEPKYCAVILQRMADTFPALTITRLESCPCP